MKRSKNSLIPQGTDGRNRRSVRESKVNENNINLINCHSCKTVDSSTNMITCCRMDCRESFCINCIKKTYVKFNPNNFLILKEKENTNCWKCFKCKKNCPCDTCVKDKEEEIQEKQLLNRKRNTKSRPRKIKKIGKRRTSDNNNKIASKNSKKDLENIYIKKKSSAFIEKCNLNENMIEIPQGLDEAKIKETIKIDDFFIYEYESEDKDIEIPFITENENKTKIKKEVVNKKEIVNTNRQNENLVTNKDILCGFNFNTDMFNDKKVTNTNEKISNESKSNKIKNFKATNIKLNTNANNNSIVNKNENIKINSNENKKLTTPEINKEEVIINSPKVKEKIENIFSTTNAIDNLMSTDVKSESVKPAVDNKSNINSNAFKIEYRIMSVSIPKVSEFNPTFINTPFIKHRPLTKPCNVCGNSHFEKSEIIKFQFFNDYIQSIKSHIEKRECLSDENIKALVKELDMTHHKKNDENFRINKEQFLSIFDRFSKGEIKHENPFKRTKRICKSCIYTLLEQEEGIEILLDAVHEEDEKAVLDANKKEEILKNIQAFFSKTGSKVMSTRFLDSKFEHENTEITEFNSKAFNIFNNIFNRRKLNEDDKKIISDLQIKNENQIKDTNKNNEIFNLLRGNFGFLNDNKYKKNKKNVKLNYININVNNYKNSQQNPLYSYLISNNNVNKDYSNEEDPTVELMDLLYKTKNQIAFHQYFNVYQKNMIEGIFYNVESYMMQVANVLRELDSNTNRMKELLENHKLNSENSQNEIKSEDSNINKNYQFTNEMSKLLEFQNINSISVTLLNMFKNIISDLKIQNNNLSSNELYLNNSEEKMKNAKNAQPEEI